MGESDSEQWVENNRNQTATSSAPKNDERRKRSENKLRLRERSHKQASRVGKLVLYWVSSWGNTKAMQRTIELN